MKYANISILTFFFLKKYSYKKGSPYLKNTTVCFNDLLSDFLFYKLLLTGGTCWGSGKNTTVP